VHGHLTSSSLLYHDTAPTELYTLSLHDALPILRARPRASGRDRGRPDQDRSMGQDRAPLPRQAGQGRPGDARVRARPRHRRQERSEEHTSELQSLTNLVCRLLLEKKKPPEEPAI